MRSSERASRCRAMLEQAPQLLRLAWPSVGSLILDQVGLPCKFYTLALTLYIYYIYSKCTFMFWHTAMPIFFNFFPRNPIALRPFAVCKLLWKHPNYQATGLTTIFFVAALDDEYLLGSVPWMRPVWTFFCCCSGFCWAESFCDVDQGWLGKHGTECLRL